MKKPKLIPRTEGHKPHQHGVSPKIWEELEVEKKGIQLKTRFGTKCFQKEFYTTAEVLKCSNPISLIGKFSCSFILFLAKATSFVLSFSYKKPKQTANNKQTKTNNNDNLKWHLVGFNKLEFAFAPMIKFSIFSKLTATPPSNKLWCQATPNLTKKLFVKPALVTHTTELAPKWPDSLP